MTHFANLVEIGAGDHQSSDALRMLSSKEITADHITLYEPHPLLCADLREKTRGWRNLTIYEEAVTSHFDPLYLMGYASYLRGNPSFLATSVEADGEKWWTPLAREVACQKVDRVDYGTIDGLVLTTNGAEIDVLKGLVSRPKVIWTKHMLHNPVQWMVAQEVWNWLIRAGYASRVLETNQHRTFYSLKHVLVLDTAPQPT